MPDILTLDEIKRAFAVERHARRDPEALAGAESLGEFAVPEANKQAKKVVVVGFRCGHPIVGRPTLLPKTARGDGGILD